MRLLLEHCPRFAGVRFTCGRTVVLLDDGNRDPLTIVLPALVCGRLVLSLEQLLRLEVERPIAREGVAPLAATMLFEAIERHHAPVDSRTFWEEHIETVEVRADLGMKKSSNGTLTAALARHRKKAGE
jgi:hypothetical protein